MHKVAITTPIAGVLLILPTCGFPKISHRREVNNDGPARIISSTKIFYCFCSIFFLSKLNINIPHHVVSQIVTNIQALNLSELVQLFKKILIEILEMFLDFARIDGIALSIDAGVDHVGALVHV